MPRFENMTKEEAITILNMVEAYGLANEAKKVAIEALKQKSCEDTISRQAVLDYIYNDLGLGDEENGKDVERQMELEDSYIYVKSLPSVKPQEKTGHWIKTISENGVTSAVRCSECGFEDNRYMLFRYCPNCEARMIEPQKSEEV